MPSTNFERMLQLADDVFSSKDDPEQLDVNESVLDGLAKIHAAAISEHDDGNGPVAWVLLFPTTRNLMNLFLEKKISEKQLFESTPLGISYDAIYLCSAMVLEEHRKKGIATKLAMDAIGKIKNDHPIKCLFVWAFTSEGHRLATDLANSLALPIFFRE